MHRKTSPLLKILAMLEQQLTLPALVEIMDVPAERVRAALEAFENRGWVRHCEDRNAYRITPEGALAAGRQTDWKECRADVAGALECLDDGRTLDGCSSLLEITNRMLDSSLSGAISLYAFLIRTLKEYDLDAHGDDKNAFFRVTIDVCDISMYLSKFHNDALSLVRKSLLHTEKKDGQIINLLYLLELSLENMAAECDEERMHFMHKKCEDILHEMARNHLQGNAEYFLGMFQFWHGQFGKVMETFDIARKTVLLWNCRFQSELFPLYTSSSAVYLGDLHTAIGILEAARREASLCQNTFKTLWWEAQLAMVLLYANHDEDALELIDHVLALVDPATETKIALWGMRGLSFYLYKRGNIAASYRQMKRLVDTGQKYGVRRLIYSYPWLVEVLLRYEEEGLPRIPGLDLEEEVQRSLRGYNSHLKAAGLRARALLMLRHGEEDRRALLCLQESLALFASVGNPREIACTAHCIRLLEKGERPTSATLRRFLESTPFTPARESPLALLKARLPRADAKGESGGLFERFTDAASRALGAERAALFNISTNRKPVAVATVNISDTEMRIGQISSRVLQYHTAQAGLPLLVDIDEHVCLSLPLRTERHNWLLWLESRYAIDILLSLSQEQIRDVAALLEKTLKQFDSASLSATDGMRPAQQSAAEIVLSDGEAMICGSPAMQRLVSYCTQVGKSDAAILLLGETGVGKDLLARYIHECSGRTGRFIAVHPASIPETLFESEFFGYEKGAFTGAAKLKIGLVEHAHQGTLFIDEAGDIPEAHQVRLLRVLQDHCFTRVGGDKPLHSDFRLVCATNKDLWQEVRNGRFREDLYYRLSVVPVTIPPLRERREDIDRLVSYFVKRYAIRYNKPLPAISEADLHLLREHGWPGNIRELKSVIERAVITETDGELSIDLRELPSRREEQPQEVRQEEFPAEEFFAGLPTLLEFQRRYLEYVLKKTNWRITGKMGALQILDVKRSTLYYWMKKYDLNRP